MVAVVVVIDGVVVVPDLVFVVAVTGKIDFVFTGEVATSVAFIVIEEIDEAVSVIGFAVEVVRNPESSLSDDHVQLKMICNFYC